MKHSKCLALKSDSENSLICSFLDSPPPLLPQAWAFDSIHSTEWKWSSTSVWAERSSFAFTTTAAIFDPCGCSSWGYSCSFLPCCGCPIFSPWAVFHPAVPSGFLTTNLQRRLPFEASTVLRGGMLSLQSSWPLITQGSLLNASPQAWSSSIPWEFETSTKALDRQMYWWAGYMCTGCLFF